MGGTIAQLPFGLATLSGLDTRFREKRHSSNRNGGKPDPELDALETRLKEVEREAREALAQAEVIEAAAYDLKAVNPNRKSEEDTRTPAEFLHFIAAKGHEAHAALARLRGLLGRQSPGHRHL